MCGEYSSWDKGKARDWIAIEKLLARDAGGLYQKGEWKLW